MAKAATPLTVTVTANLVEKDREPPSRTKKEEKHCYVLIQSNENYPTVIVFLVVDELLTINLVSIFRLKGNEFLTKSYKTGTVIWTFSSPQRPCRRGRRGLVPKLDK